MKCKDTVQAVSAITDDKVSRKITDFTVTIKILIAIHVT